MLNYQRVLSRVHRKLMTAVSWETCLLHPWCLGVRDSKSGSCNVAMSTLQLWGTGQDWVKTYESIFGYIWDGHLFASYFEVQWSTNVLIRSHLSQFRLFPSHNWRMVTFNQIYRNRPESAARNQWFNNVQYVQWSIFSYPPVIKHCNGHWRHIHLVRGFPSQPCLSKPEGKGFWRSSLTSQYTYVYTYIINM